MRFRSSGLGEDKELQGYMSDLSPVGKDLLVFHIQTTEPVQWHLRAGIQFKDIPVILKCLMKPSVLSLVISSLFYIKKDAKEPENF